MSEPTTEPDRASAPTGQRDKIVDTALDLMSGHGFAGMSMRMLANECDLNVAALYHYFPSKAELFRAVVEEQNYATRILETPQLPPATSDEDALVVLLCELLAGAAGEERIWRLLIGESIRGNDLARQESRELVNVLRTGVTAWVADTLPDEPNPDALSELIAGQVVAEMIGWILWDADEYEILGTAQRIAGAISGRRAAFD